MSVPKPLMNCSVMYVVPHRCISLSDTPQVSNAIPELSSDGIAKLWEELIAKIFELVHSQTPVEKLGGILAIGASLHVLTGLRTHELVWHTSPTW